MTFRLLGIPDELRLDIEQAGGLTTEGARLIIEQSVNAASTLMETATREIQEVIGPHGAVTRLQAGGIRISSGSGLSVFEDGVMKTTIDPQGNIFAGSNLENPEDTTFSVFVNDQIYNNEEMGAGDLLFGDNSLATSNVKFDASEGQLQFRYGTTVNVYMDTDGSLKFGGGAVVLNEEGINLAQIGDTIIFNQAEGDGSNNIFSTISLATESSDTALRIMAVGLLTGTQTNLIANGTFETGDFTSWTETDPGGKISISDIGEGYGGGYAAKFSSAVISTNNLQQSISAADGILLKFRIKGDGFCHWKVETDAANVASGDTVISGNEYQTHYIPLPGAATYFRINMSNSPNTHYVDDIEAYALKNYTTLPYAKISLSPDDIEIKGNRLNVVNATNQFLLTIYGEGASKGIYINQDNIDIDLIVSNNLIRADNGTGRVGIGDAAPGEKLDVAGNINVTGVYKIDDVQLDAGDVPITDPGGYFTSTDVEATLEEIAPFTLHPEVNADNIYQTANLPGVSGFTALINGTPTNVANSVVTFDTVTVGAATTLPPSAATHLARQILWNTTRGNFALVVSQTGLTVTVDRNVTTLPAPWANNDAITTISTTVVGGGFNWIDFEIVSTAAIFGRSALWVNYFMTNNAGAANDQARLHPYESWAASKHIVIITQAPAATATQVGLLKIVSNRFSMMWPSPINSIIVREGGYLP